MELPNIKTLADDPDESRFSRWIDFVLEARRDAPDPDMRWSGGSVIVVLPATDAMIDSLSTDADLLPMLKDRARMMAEGLAARRGFVGPYQIRVRVGVPRLVNLDDPFGSTEEEEAPCLP